MAESDVKLFWTKVGGLLKSLAPRMFRLLTDDLLVLFHLGFNTKILWRRDHHN